MDEDLVTVREFSELYQVDEMEVRRWMRLGHIPYEPVGPRRMKRIRRSMVVKPVVPILLDPNERILSSAEQSALAATVEPSTQSSEVNNEGPGTQPGRGDGQDDRTGGNEQSARRPQADKEAARNRGTSQGPGSSKGRR